ncbi:hypothetical protein FOA52_000120 [Chlamydomonas sp. UWO 241]|nr:hypothetical protein FOA52_000120 [Chlamydomonas sp. UWO 241]
MGLLQCMLKTLLAPFILLARSCWIYIGGCFGVYFGRFFRGICCGICICCGWLYKDKQFPPSAASIGALGNKSPEAVNAEIGWCRVEGICQRSGQDGARLFAGEIEPSDICQGQVGDCWLMSALACLAQVEGAIQKVFYTREYNTYGKYKLRLYDARKEAFVTVTVDDFIPVKKGTTNAMFAKPNGDEAWVLILEKAMAKFMGSYHNMDGGSCMWAFQALTGNYVFKFKQETNATWKRYEMEHGSKQGAVMLQPTTDVLNTDDMFSTVMFYTRRGSVIAASSGAGTDTENVNGIVQGHAYSITSAKQVDNFKLVQLRNPWGSFEWTGNWGDSSALWKQYPKIARAVDFAVGDDGSFWMEFKDFCQYYKNLDFCFRTTGWDDLSLDIHEQRPICGPTLGCVQGCFGFWCCCKGVKALYCSNKKQEFEKANNGCFADCTCMA